MTEVQEEFEVDITNTVDINMDDYNVLEFEEDKQLGCSSGEINIIPFVNEEFVPDLGKKFESIEKAYNFYNFYARLAGFSVRKNSTRKDPKEGFIKTQVFTCSKEGERKERKDQPSKGVITQPGETRCGCRALMKVKRTPECEYVVTRFVDGHNHGLHTPRKANMLRSQRNMDDETKRMIDNYKIHGMSNKNIYTVIAEGVGGASQAPYLQEDITRHVREVAKRTYGKEAKNLLQYFRNKKVEDQNFYFNFEVDEEGMMLNCFWVDGKSRNDFRYFGDVVTFDTTYKTNKFLMPFALFTGVNNHRQSIYFGCALLVEETQLSFEWLFEEWVKTMGGRPPSSIITDQDPAMKLAIAKVMPTTRHRFCMWHILQKLPEKVPRLSHNKDFVDQLKNCIYNTETREEFESIWGDLIKYHQLTENTWLSGLFEIRHMWLPVYMRDIFFAGMSTTQRSENMNKVLKGYVDKFTSLNQFVVQFDRALEYRRHKERKQEYDTVNSIPKLILDIPLEKHMARIFTKKLFKRFQVELRECLKYGYNLVVENERGEHYEVLLKDIGAKIYKILYKKSEGSASCSCGKFEFEGVVCRHVFTVIFKAKCMNELPPYFVLNRWTRDAKSRQVDESRGIEMTTDLRKSMHLRYNELCFLSNQVSRIGSMSEYSYGYALNILQKLQDDLMLLDLKQSEEVGSSEDFEFESEDVAFIRDPNVVRSKGSGKRYKSKRELLISKKSKVDDKQKTMVMHCEENEGGKPMRICHNCKGHGHDSRNCIFPKKKIAGKLNISK